MFVVKIYVNVRGFVVSFLISFDSIMMEVRVVSTLMILCHVGDLFITSSSKGRDCYCTCSIVDVYD